MLAYLLRSDRDRPVGNDEGNERRGSTFSVQQVHGRGYGRPRAVGTAHIAGSGMAFRMWLGDGESSAWVWTTQLFKGTPFVAYVRLKVSDNTSTGEVARFSVEGGGTEYGLLSLKRCSTHSFTAGGIASSIDADGRSGDGFVCRRFDRAAPGMRAFYVARDYEFY